jgi:hypothetical protein
VVDNTGKIVAFDEVRRGNDDETEAELRIDSITFGGTYHFLLLMGHWERNYAAEDGGSYIYTADPPTLLAAGLKTQTVTGNGAVTVTMWPLVVDTKFSTDDAEVQPVSARTAEPVVGAALGLLPVNWNVTWTIKRGTSGDGLASLIAAQKIVNSDAGDSILLKSKKTIVRGDGLADTEAPYSGEITDVLTVPVGAYTFGITRIGKGGSANFELEYIPYNKADGWAAFNGESVFDLDGGKTPVWIIRNGINSLAQDGNTDFEALGKAGYPDANGNGAVGFAVSEVPGGNGESGEYLLLKDGIFAGPFDSVTPQIQFTAEGYTGNAVGYYAVVEGGTAAPGYGEYTKTLGTVTAAAHTKQIELASAPYDYDVYVRIIKGGKVSDAIKINTKAVSVGWDWDDDEDGLSNQEEIEIGTDPDNPDTDGDGFNDGWEVNNGYDPLDPNDPDPDGDDDGDGLSNHDEYENGTDPHDPDTEGDGFNDGWEVDNGYDPLDPDDPGNSFVAVSNITGVPAAATAGTNLALTGTVAPTNATNKTITWSINNAGGTGASISGNTLYTSAAGTVRVKAAVASGLSTGVAYTQDFTITINYH